MGKSRQYFGDLFADYGNGCRLDLRAKLAADLAKVMVEGVANGALPDSGHVDINTEVVAADACDLAEDLVDQFTQRGWVDDLPTDDQLPLDVKAHLRRQVRAQAVQAAAMPHISQEEAPKLQTAVAGALDNRKKSWDKN